MDNLTNHGMLEDMLLDLYIYRLRRVGRKHLTVYQMWQEWIER